MALLVQLVVCQLQFVEVDNHRGPVGSRGRGVRVYVEAGWGTLLLKAAHPASVVLVAVLVHWGHVHEQNIRQVWLQVIHLHLDGWEHAPGGRWGEGSGGGRGKEVKGKAILPHPAQHTQYQTCHHYTQCQVEAQQSHRAMPAMSRLVAADDLTSSRPSWLEQGIAAPCTLLQLTEGGPEVRGSYRNALSFPEGTVKYFTLCV